MGSNKISLEEVQDLAHIVFEVYLPKLSKDIKELSGTASVGLMKSRYRELQELCYRVKKIQKSE